MMHIPVPGRFKTTLLAIGSLVVALSVFASVALASSTDKFFGFAWSSNVGWIKMNNCYSVTNCGQVTQDGPPTGVQYGVTVAPTGTSRDISGYAWSSNVGWITFNTGSATVGSDELANCPPTAGGASTRCAPYVAYGTSGGPAVPIIGWARVCSVYIDCTDPARGLKEAYERTKWDGWIALHDTDPTDSANFGVKLNTTTGALSGYGWGSDVVGWVDFSGVTVCLTDPCPPPPPPPECPDGTPAPGGDTTNCFCPDGVTPMPPNGICDGDPTCPDGTPVPPNGICNGDPSTTCPNGSPIPPSGICPSTPPQCSDGIDNDGDGQVDYNGGAGDPGCDDDDDNNETDSSCTVVGSPCWCLYNGYPPAECGGGPTAIDLCSNIPGDQTTIVPPYRSLSDGRCLCNAGFVLNAQYQCVKPIYVEPSQ